MRTDYGMENCCRPGCSHRRVYRDDTVYSDCVPNRCQCGDDAVYWDEDDQRWKCSQCAMKGILADGPE